MNENLKKAAEMLKNDPALKEKLGAEAKRLAETMAGKEANEILALAIKNVLGIDLTAADLNTGKAGCQELTPDAMEDVAGGNVFVDFWNMLKEVGQRFLPSLTEEEPVKARG